MWGVPWRYVCQGAVVAANQRIIFGMVCTQREARREVHRCVTNVCVFTRREVICAFFHGLRIIYTWYIYTTYFTLCTGTIHTFFMVYVLYILRIMYQVRFSLFNYLRRYAQYIYGPPYYTHGGSWRRVRSVVALVTFFLHIGGKSDRPQSMV